MNFRKIKYGLCVLVFAVLVLMGCGEKAEPPVDPGVESLGTQSAHVEGAIREIMTNMDWTGEIAGRIRTRRSLAVHILRDHVDLMVNFISKQSDKMEAWMGSDIELYSVEPGGREVPWQGDVAAFWSEIYKERAEDFIAGRIKLEVNVKDVQLKDAVPITMVRDCLAQINYEFLVVYDDENDGQSGETVCLYGGKGGTKLCHSEACPWNPCEFKFDDIK